MNKEKKLYLVEGQLRHNGEFYSPDDEEMSTIELTDKEARSLLAVGGISVPEDQAKESPAHKAASATAPALDQLDPNRNKPEPEPQKVTAPTDQVERLAEIKEAIGLLEKGNEAHWLADGVTPDVKALEGVLGWGISAAERNQAFADLATMDVGE